MKVEVKEINPIEYFEIAAELLQENWKASGAGFDFIPQDARKLYEFLRANGSLFGSGAFVDGKMVGYCIITITPNPVNHAVKVCSMTGMYLKPEFRKARATLELMDIVRRIAKDHKVDFIDWHAAAGSEFLRVLQARYKPVNSYFREQL